MFLPEAKLTRETEMRCMNIFLVTDFDAWKEGEEVTNYAVIARRIIKNLILKLSRREIKMLLLQLTKEIAYRVAARLYHENMSLLFVN
jgi:purine nucleoside phosphorylase